MSKGKLAKFAEMAQNPLVVECPMSATMQQADVPLSDRWHTDFFHTPNPIVLELGCGRGEYTVGLASQTPDKNFIGVDIKGARMWTGAKQALEADMKNVAFLRTNIEFIHRFFAPGEVSEVWLTFSDPQMKKVTKRLTYFLERYRHFLTDGGIVHLKTDSNFLFTYTEELLRANGIEPLFQTRDLYQQPCTEGFGRVAQSIQTYYESMWRARGIDIKYLCFRLHGGTPLVEPDIEIPLDDYRSYSREKRSSSETHV